MDKSKLMVGKKAPTFTLPDQNGKKVRLRDMNGEWVVVYFYSKDGTPSCTTESRDFSSSAKRFEKLNAEVVGISPDPPESHKKFSTKNRLKVHLLSDEPHRVMEKYGARGRRVRYGKRVTGPIRSTVLIDPKGKVAARWSKVRVPGHAKAVQAKLAELQRM